MTSLISGHLTEVGAELRGAPHLLLGLDFDGTLAPIVSRPEDARIPEETRSILKTLASRPDVTIAIVSGRALPDLVSRVGLDVILATNHGLEISGDGFDFRYPGVENRRRILHRICEEISQESAHIPGVLVEDKGLTASVHFRGVAEFGRERIFSIIRAAAAAQQDRFEVRRGKEVLEIVPRVPWDKGAAVLWIVEQLRTSTNGAVSVCYIGDDATDEDVFHAVDGITICVGENPSTEARFGVSDTIEAADFLRWLASTPIAHGRAGRAHESPGSTLLSANR